MTKYKSHLSFLLFVLSGLTLYYFILLCWYLPATLSSDDLTLFNPVFQWLQTSQLNYVIYEGNHVITVHPPCQYFLVSFFMSLGINSQIAYSLPFVISAGILLLINFCSPFTWPVKFAVVVSLQLIHFFPVTSIRPDVTLAVLWFSSILLLETAALKRNSFLLYFLGSALWALSGIWHYYGLFGLFGVLFYLPFRNFNAAKAKIWWMVFAGIFVVLIPFFGLYVLPNISEILNQVHLNQGGGNMLTAWKRHLAYYPAFSVLTERLWFCLPALFVHACYSFYGVLPVIVCLFSIYNLSIRRMLLSSLPLLFTILLFSQGKSDGYFVPELLMLMFIAAYLCFRATTYLFSAGNVSASILGAILGCSTISIVLVNLLQIVAATSLPLTLQHHEMHKVRWCSKQLLGTSASVAGKISTWYISGAQKWTNVSTMLTNITQADDKKVLLDSLVSFSAMAETKHMANTSENKQNITLNTLYIDSSLALSGFVFSENGGYESELATLFYTVGKQKPIAGFVCRNGNTTLKVTETDTGSFVFLVYTVIKQPGLLDSILLETAGAVALNYFPLPEPNQVLRDFRYEHTSLYLAFMLIKKTGFIKNKHLLERQLKIRDAISCSLKVCEEYNNTNFRDKQDSISYQLQ